MARMWTVSLVLFLFSAITNSGCGTSETKQCSSANCTGCCDAADACQAGDSNLACGVGSQQCTECALGSLCQVGVCNTTSTGGGGGGVTGGGGGITGGGGATGGGGGVTGGGGGTADGGAAANTW